MAETFREKRPESEFYRIRHRSLLAWFGVCCM